MAGLVRPRAMAKMPRAVSSSSNGSTPHRWRPSTYDSAWITASTKLIAASVPNRLRSAGLPRRSAAWPCELTGREVEVLRLCARGLTNRQIADALFLSSRTVQHHLASVYDKTGRRTRAGAAVFAVEHGLHAAD